MDYYGVGMQIMQFKSINQIAFDDIGKFETEPAMERLLGQNSPRGKVIDFFHR
jgi:hypothetical protein